VLEMAKVQESRHFQTFKAISMTMSVANIFAEASSFHLPP